MIESVFWENVEMNVLIAGKNSYIGTHIGRMLEETEPEARVTYLSVRDEEWKALDLSGYDAVVFAAAIVHRKDITDPQVYHRVNALLPYEFAKKAKAEGVKKFLFLSTAGVYGVGKGLPWGNVITADTPLKPVLPYQVSKLEGENLLRTLEDDAFLLSIVRTINVYGVGCPGNYIGLFKKITRSLPVLPKAYPEVKQGFVHVDSLSRLCILALKADRGGIYHAQDPETVSAYEILSALAKGMGLKKKTLPCHRAVRLLPKVSPVVKFFGGVAYDPALAECPLGDYHSVECKLGLENVAKE